MTYAMKHPEEWQHLGSATNEEALFQSQMIANLGVAVVAVSNGHVAPVMPGELYSSGKKWGWRKVPMIYNSVKNNPSPSSSYYYGPMHLAWELPDKVQIFALWNR